MSLIHPTAIVDAGAQLHESVEIGPYAIIGSGVKIGKNTTVGPYTVIDGDTIIGENNRIFQSVSIGVVPQDLKFHGEASQTIIGNNNTIREFATIHRGTEASGKTVIGDHNLLMVYTHIAHDCVVGNHCILSNCATLAGHVILGDHVIIGGFTPVHQFVKIGHYAMVGGASAVAQDIIPYVLAEGNKTSLHGLNVVGLKRRGFSAEVIKDLKDVYKILFRSHLLLSDALEEVKRVYGHHPHVKIVTDFIEASERGICR